MEIQTVSFETDRLDAMREFYCKQLSLPQVNRTRDSFSIELGRTTLQFIQSSSDDSPFYHYTLNIPGNQFAEAKSWLGERTEILETPAGDYEVYFELLDFHSVYFFDPAGNLGELSARHGLPNESHDAFSAESIECVSEVGLPVPDVSKTVDKIEKELSIKLHPKVSDAEGQKLVPVGDDRGMLVIAEEGKEWFMTEKPATPHPLSIRVSSDRNAVLQFTDLPYRIELSKGV